MPEPNSRLARESKERSTSPGDSTWFLKAYGLWMLERHEEYRFFVYQYAERGEVWSYGFAADAANKDPDPRRALDMIDRYKRELVHGPYLSDYSLHYLDFQIAVTAGKLGEAVLDLSPRHLALIHPMLDRSLQTREVRAEPKLAALFTLMGREEDAERYLAQVQKNYEKCDGGRTIRLLLQGSRTKESFNSEELGQMHRVLDAYLKDGSHPTYSTKEIHRIFQLMGRGSEIENKDR